MKRLIKISGMVGLLVILLYLVSIPIIRFKNPIKESVFFTPTKYDSTKVFNQLDSTFLTNISKDSILFAAHRFVGSRKTDSLVLNGTKIKRTFQKFTDDSESEFYSITPESYKKIGIFMMGNTFNAFNVFNQITELAQKAGIKIYIIVYNGNGYSEGESSFKNQFSINQEFYSFINSTEKVDYILGHSLGTVFATKLGVENKVPNLILLAPASNLNDMISYFKGLSNVLFRPYFNTAELKKSKIDHLSDNSQQIKTYTDNLLLIHGTKDTNLPYFMSEKILKNCPSNSKHLITIPNGGHYAAFEKENWNKLIAKIK